MGMELSKREYQRLLKDGWDPDKSYVFVSYASRDWPQVYPTVLALRERGINVYIDVEFLENQSSSWLKNFRERLFRDRGCRGIVTFLSINYMRSYACLMEQLANRTTQMRRRKGKPLPIFYVALEPELGTLQQMSSYIYDDAVMEASVRESVEMSPPETMVLQQFILDSHFEDYRDPDSVEKMLGEIHDKHDVVTTMYELIFEEAPDMPSIMAFEGADLCADLLTANFVNDKNPSIKLEVLDALRRDTALRRQGKAPAPAAPASPEPPAAEAAPAPAPEPAAGAEPEPEAVPAGEAAGEPAPKPADGDQELEDLILRAQRGDSGAQNVLGNRYKHGDGVPPGFSEDAVLVPPGRRTGQRVRPV